MKPQARAAPKIAEAPGADIAAHIAELEKRPPGDWLDRVRILKGEGRSAEADRLLAEFKRRFPEESIPADLR
jgi:hypothetical protein